MRPASLAIALLLTLAQTVQADAPALDFEMKTIDGESIDLAKKYANKVVLFVNVASKCGFTRQYEGLQELHAQYADQGLAIVGVPCNQYGGQEPGSASEIVEFCQTNYGVEFDLLEKVDVKGENACPLYVYLTGSSPYPGRVEWNFEKFLIDKNGEVAGRYPSDVEPGSVELTADIERELAKSSTEARDRSRDR
ncbi:MAG: glutathione peroxidase [Planctomycetota bacterium]